MLIIYLAFSSVPYVFLSILDSHIHQLGILRLLGCGEDEGWVGSGILWLVLLNSCSLSVLMPLEHRMNNILLKSPESQTTVYSKHQRLMLGSIIGGAVAYSASGLELFQ